MKTLYLTEQLIARRSVTPDDGGCQQLLRERLAPLGFDCETIVSGPDELPRHQPVGQAPVQQAGRAHPGLRRPHRRGAHRPAGAVEQRPLRADAPRRQAVRPRRGGHEDLDRRLRGGRRGVRGRPPAHPALSLAFLLTSDEEGPSVDGTVVVCRTAARRAARSWTAASSASPARSSALGDMIKNGRRGSLLGPAHGARRAGPHRLPAAGEEPDPPRRAGAGRTGGDRVGPRQRLLPAHQLPGQQHPRRHRRQQRDPGRAWWWTSTSASAPSRRPRR